ncbi:SRPBCC family protein [Streptosporangium sp. NPDC000563]|uniref:SRPBCC family protein n=1 Tax=unclassified Streptosporangium TaxID=2632669 RepID=UPI00332A9CD5
MIEVRVSIEMDHPAADIWRIVADFGQDPRWRAGVTTMAPDPPGIVVPGTTTEEMFRFAGGVYYISGVVTSVVPGREFLWRGTSGIEVVGGRSVVPLDDDRCLLTIWFQVRPPGLLRLRAPILGRMLRRKLQRNARRLGDLVTSDA